MSRKARNKKYEAAGKHAATATVAPPSKPVPAKQAERQTEVAERTWLEDVWRRLSRLVGSLQVAVVLLVLFAAVLAIGTVAESRYHARVAQELVYRTWWFQLLLLLLGANILFAALKKWPWKKHQTGFLITHLGLLTMLAGGIWNAASGTDALVTLIDSGERAVREEQGLPQVTRTMVLADEHELLTRRVSKDEKEKSHAFSPGSLPWRSDDHLEVDLPVFTSLLSWLAHPLPHSWSRDLGDGATLSVENYYPHAHNQPFSPANGGPHSPHGSFPALRVGLWAPQMGRVPPFWLADSTKRSKSREWPYQMVGPAMAELIGKVPAELLQEFLSPPRPEELAPKGQLVVYHAGRLHRVPVEPSLGRIVPLGDTGASVRIVRYLATQRDPDSAHPGDPGVQFEFIAASGTTTKYSAVARLNTRGGAVDADGKPQPSDPLRSKIWYHAPDHRYGRESMAGLLQFVQAEDKNLYYRAFHKDAGAFRLETSGLAMAPPAGLNPAARAATKSEMFPIWKGMKWRLQVLEYLPEASDEPRLVPENHRPGLQREDLLATLRCKLKHKSETKEFFLAQGQTREVNLGGETFEVTYNIKQRDLGFQLKLLRAEQRVDDGSTSPATYTSFVQVTDDGEFSHSSVPEFIRPITNFVGLTWGGVTAKGEDHVITMNEPLAWDGYNVYQSQYDFRQWDARERPVSLSGFTVGRDPGMFLKYLGSSMLALGIACMFYMRAYLITGKKRGPGLAKARAEEEP